jgi:hypothetical protein
MEPGFNTTLGFDEQTVDGGGDPNSLILKQGRYSIKDNTDTWGYTYGKTNTTKGISMVAANFETIGSAVSAQEVQLVNGTLLINAMGDVSDL